MRILVTGGTGFIGGAMIPALVARGHEVIGVARRIPGAGIDGARWVQGDLAAPLSELPEVDAVVHLAQATAPLPQKAEEMHAVNTGSTLRLLEHARRCGARRFLFASTGNVYGFGDRPFTENDPLKPDGFYAITKVNAENLVRGYREYFDTVLLRYFTPYGKGQTGRTIPNLISRVRNGDPIVLREGGRPRLTPICIDDAVEASCRMLELAGHHTVNVAGDEHVDLRQIATMAGELCGRDPVFEQVSEPSAGDLMAENARMKQMTGLHTLVSFREGLARMIGLGTLAE